MNRFSRLGFLLAVITGVSYGLSLVAARASYDYGVNFMTIIACRYVLLCTVLSGFLFVTHQPLKLTLNEGTKSFFIGLIALSTSISYLASAVFIPVSLTTIIFYTHPLVTVWIATKFSGERSTGFEVAATAVACLGLILVLNVTFLALDHWGVLLGLYASVSAAAVFIMSNGVLTRVDPVRFTLHMAVGGALVACITLFMIGGIEMPISRIGWVWFAMAITLNVVGLILMFASVSMIGPVSTPMILNIEPVTAIIFAVLLLNESMTVIQVVGASIVLVAVLLAQISRVKRAGARV